MVRSITTREELEHVLEHGAGYLYNDFGGGDPKYCPIHRPDCYHLRQMLRVGPGKLEIPKIYADGLVELVAAIDRLGKLRSPCRSEPDIIAEYEALSNSREVTYGRPLARLRGAESKIKSNRAAGHGDQSAKDWHIETSVATNRVDAWSSFRLGFEPKGTQADFKRALASTITRVTLSSRFMPDSPYSTTGQSWPSGLGSSCRNSVSPRGWVPSGSR